MQDLSFVRDHLPFHALYHNRRMQSPDPLPWELVYDETAILRLLERGLTLYDIGLRLHTRESPYCARGSDDDFAKVLQHCLANRRILAAALQDPRPPGDRNLFWLKYPEDFDGKLIDWTPVQDRETALGILTRRNSAHLSRDRITRQSRSMA